VGETYQNACPRAAWKALRGTNFARLSEVSFCDHFGNPDATFAYVKINGQTEMRKRPTAAVAMSACWDDTACRTTMARSWCRVNPATIPPASRALRTAGARKPA